MTRHDPADIAVTPADQRRAAELVEAALRGDGNQLGEHLADLHHAGTDRTLATIAVLARNLAVTLVAVHGDTAALKIIESTRLDALLADDDHPPHP
ncbi:MAG: hypothetical protein KDB56_10730 [Mycobacterium sp.]|nr:hypothetical protein [Mycobacterium sp.]